MTPSRPLYSRSNTAHSLRSLSRSASPAPRTGSPYPTPPCSRPETPNPISRSATASPVSYSLPMQVRTFSSPPTRVVKPLQGAGRRMHVGSSSRGLEKVLVKDTFELPEEGQGGVAVGYKRVVRKIVTMRVVEKIMVCEVKGSDDEDAGSETSECSASSEDDLDQRMRELYSAPGTP